MRKVSTPALIIFVLLFLLIVVFSVVAGLALSNAYGSNPLVW